MKARNDTQNGIDIGASCICWARAIPRDGLVTNVGIQPLVTGHVEWWDSVRDGLVELVGAVKLLREDVAVSIPADIALIKKVRMDPDAVIEWELSQQLPGSTDEYAWDRTEISAEGATREFLVAGCGRHTIERVQVACKAAKVTPSVVDIDLFALVNDLCRAS